MQSGIETITPKVASRYLQANTGNRPLRRTSVEQLARAMLRNEWRLTHQGIAFSASGRLLDGQHRLQAVVDSGVSVQMVIVRGLPDDAFMAMDIGNRRTTADVLSADKKVVEVASLICKILTSTNRPTPDEIAAWIPLIEETHGYVTGGSRSNTQFVSSAGMRLAAILSIEDGSDPSYVRDMYAALVSMRMENLPPVGQALVGQIAASSAVKKKGSGGAVSWAALSRGMVVFDESKAALRRLLVKDQATANVWARKLLLRMEQSHA